MAAGQTSATVGDWKDVDPGDWRDVESTPEKTIKMKTRGGGTTDVKQSALESGPSASESPFLERTSAAMKGFREGKPQDFLGNLGAAGVELFSPEVQTLGYMGTGGAAYGAGKALLSGAARPALGLAAGFGTGVAVDKAAQALGAPPWLAAEIATLAGAAVGGKVGSPEIAERFKSGGLKGVVSQWMNGPVKEEDAIKFYKESHPEIAGRELTGRERLTARAEAVDFKKKVAESLKPKLEPKPLKPTGKGPSTGVHPGPTGPPFESSTRPELTAAQKIKAGRGQEGATTTSADTGTADVNYDIHAAQVHEGQRVGKDLRVAQLLKKGSWTPAKIRALKEEEFEPLHIWLNAELKKAGQPAIRKPGANAWSRPFEKLKEDLANEVERIPNRNADLILKAVNELESVKGVPVTTQRLRANTGLSKADFDEGALELRKQQKAFLHEHHDPHNLSEADRQDLIYDPVKGTYHVAVAVR